MKTKQNPLGFYLRLTDTMMIEVCLAPLDAKMVSTHLH